MWKCIWKHHKWIDFCEDVILRIKKFSKFCADYISRVINLQIFSAYYISQIQSIKTENSLQIFTKGISSFAAYSHFSEVIFDFSHWLIQFCPMFPFYAFWKYQKKHWFSVFFRRYKMGAKVKNGLNFTNFTWTKFHGLETSWYFSRMIFRGKS